MKNILGRVLYVVLGVLAGLYFGIDMGHNSGMVHLCQKQIDRAIHPDFLAQCSIEDGLMVIKATNPTTGQQMTIDFLTGRQL